MTPGGTERRVSRSRRLKRRRLIRPLFARGASDVGRVREGTVRLLWRTVPREATGHDVPLQVGFATGRTRTKVLRNRIRRVLRETFRLHQAPLLARLDGRPDALTVFVLFHGPADRAPDAIRRDLPRALDRLAQRLDDAPSAPPTP